MSNTKDNETTTVKCLIIYWSRPEMLNAGDDTITGFSESFKLRVFRIETVLVPESNEISNALENALNLAKPRMGEVLLNTVYA